MKSNSYKLILFLFSILISGCSSSEINYTEKTIDGVKHIHNLYPKFDKPQVKLELVRQFGADDSEGENYYLYKPADIIKDNDGNYYILDAGNYLVKKYDPDGKFLLSFGRKGQGPGEFEYPSQIVLNQANELLVVDGNSRTINMFDTDGNFIEFVRIVDFNLPKIFALPNRNYVISSFVISDKADKKLLYVLDNEFKVIREFLTPVNYNDFMQNMFLNNIYHTIDKDGNIVTAYSAFNKIEKYNTEGVKLLSFDRDVGFEESVLRQERGMLNNSFSTNVQVDSKNRIWALTFMEGEADINRQTNKKMLEVFDENGILLFRMFDEA
ncbi:6-bladed beta-propeller, partial [candidate division KSB1 bacterium]|nr:6-bladed beta-propeller [candidate division KSB1 bacterium]